MVPGHSLASSVTLKFPWFPGYAGLPGRQADTLAKTGEALPSGEVLYPFFFIPNVASSEILCTLGNEP